jgi:hypothetical protein
MTRFRLKIQPIVDLEETITVNADDCAEVNINNEPSTKKVKLKTIANLFGDTYLADNFPSRNVGSVLICTNIIENKEIGLVTFNSQTDNGKVLTIDDSLPLKVGFKTSTGGGGSSTLPNQEFTEVTGNYTLLSTDYSKIVIITNTSTLTLPLTFNSGYQVTVFNQTATTITFSTSGTLLAKGTTCTNRYGAVYLTYKGNNTWIAIGDLA